VAEPSGTPETGEPSYFIMGDKSSLVKSEFLLCDGFDQIRRVFAQLTANPRLDLYAKKAA